MSSKPQFVRLGELVRPSRRKNKNGDVAAVYSVTNSRGFAPSGDYFSKEVFSKELRTYRVVERGSIAYNPSRINVGSVALQDKEDEVIVSPLYVVFSVDSQRMLPEYAVRFLKSKPGLDQIASQSIGTVRNNLKFDALCRLDLRLPSLDEQRRMLATLRSVEREIDEAREALDKLDTLVKSRFVEMFDGVSWDVVPVSTVMSFFRNGVSPSKDGEAREMVLTLSAITQGSFDSSAAKVGSFKVTPAFDKRVEASSFLICRGNGNRSLVGTGEFPDASYENLVFPDTMIAARVDENAVDKTYLSALWKRPFVRNQIEGKARTTNGTFKINQQMIKEIRIPLPPLSLQREFAAFAAQVDKSESIARKQIEKLRTLYDSLAQEYFG